MRTRSQVVRRCAAVVAGVALAAAGAGVAGALQANATPDTTRITSVSASNVAAKPAITIKSDKAKAKAWAKVTFTGKTTGIAAGSVVQVQRLQGGKWVNFAATTKVTKSATYSVWVQSGRKGINEFRVVTAKAASPAVPIAIL